MLSLSLCNELLANEGLSLDRQCRNAKELGYMGLELAPGTLAEAPHQLSAEAIEAHRATIAGHGLAVTGLHWLLAPYPALSITEPDRSDETQAVLMALMDLCASLGGTVLVHGSPAQRVPPSGEPPSETRRRVAAFFAPLARRAETLGLVYCLEPLSPKETPFVNTVAEAVQLVEAVGSASFRTMIDTSAAGQSEDKPVADLIRQWVPTGLIGHIQVNDTNRGAPGTGSDPFPEIVRALIDVGWEAPVAVEPFETCIDATVTAAVGAATMRACWEAVQ